MKYIREIENLYELHKKIIHGEVKNIDGSVIDNYQKKADEFFKVVLKLIRDIFD